MKKFTLTAIVLCIALSTATFAATGREVKDVSVEKKDEKVELTYLSKGDAKVRVNIYDQYGKTVYSETIKHPSSFVKSYDLSKLPKAKYEFEIIDDQKVVTEIVSFVEEATTQVKASVAEETEGKFTVKVTGELVKPVLVNIYSKSGELVYGDYISFDKSFSRSYDLSKIAVKDLKFEVIQDGEILAEANF